MIIKRPSDSLTALTGPYGTEFSRRGQMVDSITFREEDATGTYAQFVVPHEYAHAAHHTNLGGISGFQRTNNCKDHTLTDINSMGCAAVEGFADFWAALARWPAALGDSVHYVYDDLSQNRYLLAGGNSVRDGSRIEGAVASFLLDIVDGIGADTIAGLGTFQDSLQLSPGLITGVVRDCRVFTYYSLTDNTQNATLRADGIDHWVYCLEQEMRRTITYAWTIFDCDGKSGFVCSGYNSSVNWDNSFFPGIRDAYFAQRVTAPSTAQDRTPQYPVAWQMGTDPPNSSIPPRPEVRRLWLCNLYGQRCSSRSLAPPFP